MNIWYNRYFGNYLSLSDILMGRGVRPVKVLFLQLMKPIDILFLSDAAVLLYIRLRLSSNCSEQFKPIPYTLNRGVWALIILTLLTMQILLTNNRFGGSKPLQLYQQSTSAYANVYGIIPLYSLEYFMLFHPQNFTTPEVAETPLKIENDLMGEELVKTGQNIICIQVESLDSNIIGYSYEGKEVTPFLNSLKEEALYFDNFYAQHVNGSFDAEFSFFTSIYPINKNYGFKVNDLTAFDSLVEKLNRKNYTTMAFHGNDKTFFSRDKAYDELGFHEFYSREDYDETSMRYSNEGSYLGINDYDFFQQSADFLDTAEEFFFAFFITVTSHTPFDFYPEELAVEEFEDIQNPLV
ncbi:MAG: LTA synthase family protein, partial [Spirochaetia bacterium]|nr:LTA synthase family protein [Spirochaetia bacterium]